MANEPIILDVNTKNDENDGSASQGKGLSLRDAILIANADPDNHYIINLPSGTYKLIIKNILLPPTDSSVDESTLFQSRLATGDLDIIGNITIIGTDPTNTIIDAETLKQSLPNDPVTEVIIGDRIFDVLSGARSGKKLRDGSPANGNLTLQNVTIKNGLISEDNIDAKYQGGTTDGGALNIDLDAKATLINTIVSNSQTKAGQGGAINNSGTLTLEKSIVRDNNSGDNAGGIYNTGTIIIRDSAIINNLADAAAPDFIEGGGGGILNETGATLVMVNTTVSGNRSASQDGNDPPSGAGDGGGGIINRGTARIINSTIVNNFAQVGSGIYSETTSANTILYNTIVANNEGSPDLDGFFDPRSGFNLVSNANGSILDAKNGNIVGGFTTPRIDVKIGPLQDNGGPTPTHALLSGSPAIDKGDTEQVNILLYFDDPPADQRGFNRITGKGIDIGAYESSSSPITINNTPNQENPALENPTNIDSPPDNTNNSEQQGINSETTDNSLFPPNSPPTENRSTPILNDPLYRFQNGQKPGTFLFVNEGESQIIRRDFLPPFIYEGFAFNVSLEKQDGLVRFNRFQSKQNPGTYLFASEAESIGIRANYSDKFFEEGIAFYAYGADANLGQDVFRYQSKINPGTFLFVLEAEKNLIDSQYASLFSYEGVAFEVTT